MKSFEEFLAEGWGADETDTYQGGYTIHHNKTNPRKPRYTLTHGPDKTVLHTGSDFGQVLAAKKAHRAEQEKS